MWRVSAGWRLRRNSPDEEVMGPNMNFSEVSTTMKCIISLTIQSAVAFPGVSADQLHAWYCFQMCSTIRIRLRARGSRGDRCISGGSDVFIPTKPKKFKLVRSTLVSLERSCVIFFEASRNRLHFCGQVHGCLHGARDHPLLLGFHQDGVRWFPSGKGAEERVP